MFEMGFKYTSNSKAISLIHMKAWIAIFNNLRAIGLIHNFDSMIGMLCPHFLNETRPLSGP